MLKAMIWGCRGLKKKKTFDPDKADMVESKRVVGTVEFSVPVSEAGEYEDKEVIILTVDEYKALTEGYQGSMSTEMRNRLREALQSVVGLLEQE